MFLDRGLELQRVEEPRGIAGEDRDRVRRFDFPIEVGLDPLLIRVETRAVVSLGIRERRGRSSFRTKVVKWSRPCWSGWPLRYSG